MEDSPCGRRGTGAAAALLRRSAAGGRWIADAGRGYGFSEEKGPQKKGVNKMGRKNKKNLL